MRITFTFLKKGSLPLSLLYILFLFFIHNSYSQNYPVSDFDPGLRQIVAFPGAEGFGKFATGGRGGQVLKVTNLNDSGPGSLRDALMKQGPRIVVFEVSGTIRLVSPINVRNPDLTIAGQTAPGDGITIANYQIDFVNMKNVIVRYIRFRPGDVAGREIAAAYGVYMDNAIFDHCSFSWSPDEITSFYGVRNFTLQWSITSEALNNSIHSKGAHGYGAIAGGKNVSWHHNLFAHATQRMVMFDHPGLYRNEQEIQDWRGVTDFRNNVIYNWRDRASSNGVMGQFNLINNYYKKGPATSGDRANFILNPERDSNGVRYGYGKFFLIGNILEGNSTVNSDNWRGVGLEDVGLTQQFLSGTRLTSPLVADVYSFTPTAQESYTRVLDNAGANLVRDPVDIRIIQETRNGTFTFTGSKGSRFGIIDSQADVGGWPVLKNLQAPIDSDQDGLPDTWELANALNPNRSNDSEYNLSPYYTDIEVYINSLVDNLVKNQYPSTPLTVVPLLPVANATNIAPLDVSFAWGTVPNADSYQLQISKSSTFASGNITLSNIRNLSLLQSQLDANSTYFWRVRALRNGVWGSFSPVRSFQTTSLAAIPQAPVLLQPGNGLENIGLSPFFKWAKVPNALTYDIQISTVSSFSSLVINQTGLSSTEFQSPKLLENQTYFWRVRARNASGVGGFSATGSFRTVSFSSIPLAVLPIRPISNNTVNPQNVRFEWYAQPTAETYRLQVSTNSNFSSYVLDRSGLTSTNFTIANLNSNTTYFWRVVGVNRSGTGWNSNGPSVFKTGAYTQTPGLISLVGPDHDSNVFATGIQFRWAGDPIAQSYRIQVSTSANFTSFVSNLGGITTTSATINNLSPNQNYYWRVQGVNNVGSGPFSEIRKVRSATFSGPPPAIKLSGPANRTVLGSSSVEFTWETQPNTENYRLDISEMPNFSVIAFRQNSIKGTRFTVTGLQANKTYYWRIHPSNQAGWGPFSDIWSFNTIAANIILSPPSLLFPSNGSNFASNNVTLTWANVPDATAYHLQISESAEFGTMAFQNQNISGTSQNLTTLVNGKAYFWRIRARNNSVFSNWSPIGSFSIGAPGLVLGSGLVGYWPTEEGSGNRMIDQSGNNLNATIQNISNVAWVSGKVGRAIRLNGGTGRYGVIAHQPILNTRNSITLAAWVRPSVLQRGHIFFKDAGNGFELWLDSDGRIEFRLNRTNNGFAYRLRSNFSYANSLNQWIHVAATFDGVTSRLYINGQIDSEATYAPFEIGTTSGTLTLGSWDTIHRWIGDLDELRLYNRALSDNEILMLTSQSSNNIQNQPVQTSNLVAHWRMEEDSGNVLQDATGNGHQATFVNNGGITWSSGRIGLGLNLTGNTDRYAKVPHRESLSLPNAITLAAWVKPNILHRGTIANKAAGNGFELWLTMEGNIEFRLNRGNNGFTYKLLTPYKYSNDIGKWIHVAATFDGQTSKIYINGVENIAQTYGAPFVIGTTSGDLNIGALGSIQRLNGSLDDLRLYSNALSASEIVALANPGQQAMKVIESEALKSNMGENSEETMTVLAEQQSLGEEKLALQLYPNPAEDIININHLWVKDGSVQVMIYDMNGRIRMHTSEQVYFNHLRLEIGHLGLPTGTYVLLIQDNLHRERLRFIKK